MDCTNQVHVESLESLERLGTRLNLASGRLEEICDQSLREIQSRLEIAHADFENAIRTVEDAASKVSSCEIELAECEPAGEASCNGDDADGADSAGWEAGDSSAAMEALEAAQEALARAEAGLESARERRDHARRAHEAICSSVFLTRQHLDHHLGAGIRFLRDKADQLRTYLLNHPELAGASPTGAAWYAHAWLGWTPPSPARIRPSLLVDRFSLPEPALEELTRRWASEDPSFARQIGTLRERHAQAGDPEEREAVRMASRRGASGRLGELIAENALRPMARSVELQRRTHTDDNANVTISDIVLRGLHMPVDWGKLQLPTGADAGIEVKCGSPAYLKQQLTHMNLQVAGHHREQASFCFLSRDFRRLDRVSKREIARTLGKKRAKTFAVLPEKSTLDSLVWKQITRT